jgi:hypothetical protein
MTPVDARNHDLLFLLGLAPLALGCAVGVVDDGPQFTSVSPGSAPGEAGSAAEDDTGGSAEDGSAGATSNVDDGMSASVSVSVSVSDDGSTSGASASASVSVSVSVGNEATTDEPYGYTTGGPPPYGSPCEAYAYVIAACYYGGDPMAAANYAANCEYGISYFEMTFGPACAMAFEDSRACISQLSCQELMMYGNGVCDVEQAAFDAACT